MQLWRKLAIALGAAAVVATVAGGPRAQDALTQAAASIYQMLPQGAKDQAQDIAVGVAINDGIRQLDTVAKTVGILQTPDCAAFRSLKTAAAVNGQLAAMQSGLDQAKAAMDAAAAELRSKEFEEESALDELNNASIPINSPAHEALRQTWQEARAAYATAQAKYQSAQRLFLGTRTSGRVAAACAAAAEVLLAQSQSPNAASNAAPAEPSLPPGPEPAPPPPNPAGPVATSGQSSGCPGNFQGVVAFDAAGVGHWAGHYTAHLNTQYNMCDATVTWTQAPDNPNVGEGSHVGEGVTWTFALTPSGDIDQPRLTPWGNMSGHIDPVTRIGNGVSAGQCAALGPPIACNGTWTATP